MRRYDEDIIVRLLEELGAKEPEDSDAGFADELFIQLQSASQEPAMNSVRPTRQDDQADRLSVRGILARRPSVAAIATFILVLTIGLAGGLVAGQTGQPEGIGTPGSDPTSSITTSPASVTTAATNASTSIATPTLTATPGPSLPESLTDFLHAELGVQRGLIPGSSTEGDRSVIDATFTDGTRVHILYPTDWPIDEYGWTPSTDVVYELDEPRYDGASVIHAQLLFTYGTDGNWSMRLEPMAIWSDAELALAKSSIELHKEANGFVTVTTTRPFSHYTRDPKQAPFSPDFRGRSPWIDVDDILGVTATDTCAEDPEHPYPQRETGRITWCDEDAGVIITFAAPQIYHDEILDNVDVRLVTGESGGLRISATSGTTLQRANDRE